MSRRIEITRRRLIDVFEIIDISFDNNKNVDNMATLVAMKQMNDWNVVLNLLNI